MRPILMLIQGFCREEGTPNRLTKELRDIINDFLQEQNEVLLF